MLDAAHNGRGRYEKGKIIVIPRRNGRPDTKK